MHKPFLSQLYLCTSNIRFFIDATIYNYFASILCVHVGLLVQVYIAGTDEIFTRDHDMHDMLDR